MIKYKIDILHGLKEKGYSTYKLRQNKILSESTIQKIRTNNNNLNFKTLNVICKLLNKQPGDIMEYVPDKDCLLSGNEDNRVDSMEDSMEGSRIDNKKDSREK